MRHKLIAVAFVVAGVVAVAGTAGAGPTQVKKLISGHGVPGGRDRMTLFSPLGKTTWAPAYIVNKDSLWASPIPGTNWISFSSTSASQLPYPRLSRYVFRTDFQLPLTFHNPSLVIKVMADNSAAVYVNGRLAGSQPCCSFGNFQGVSTFTDTNPSHFRKGRNSLRIVVGDYGAVGGLDYLATIGWST
jgi:hypothetical protein